MNLFFNVLWRTLGHGGLRKAPKLEIRPYFLIPGRQRESAGAAACAHRGKGRKGRTKEGEGRTNGGTKVGRGRGMKGKGERNEGK